MLNLGVMMGLKRRRLRIGRDVGLIGFDDAVWTQAVEPPLSVIAQPAYEMGVAAAKLLVDRIRDGGHVDPQTMIMSTTMIVRGSSRRARSRTAAARPMRYHGDGLYQWDTWCHVGPDGLVHAFYLQQARPDGSVRRWTRTASATRQPQPDRLGGAAADRRAAARRASSVTWSTGPVRRFRTATGSTSSTRSDPLPRRRPRSVDRSRHQRRPVDLDEAPAATRCSLPDGRWYDTEQSPGPNGVVDCRDLMVVKHPSRPGWFGVSRWCAAPGGRGQRRAAARRGVRRRLLRGPGALGADRPRLPLRARRLLDRGDARPVRARWTLVPDLPGGQRLRQPRRPR